MITLPLKWSDENEIRRMFNWLTRIGAAPKFGSRPIGWYQMHQCKAIELLEKACVDALLPRPVELKAKCTSRTANDRGFLYTRPMIYARARVAGAKWKPILSVNDLYAEADRQTRK